MEYGDKERNSQYKNSLPANACTHFNLKFQVYL